MELLVKPEMLTSYIYGPTFGNAETVSFISGFTRSSIYMTLVAEELILLNGK